MLKLFRYNLFNPFLFPIIFIFGYFLFSLKLSDVLNDVNVKVTLYVFGALILYCFGVFMGFLIGDRKKSQDARIVYRKKTTRYILILYIFCMILFLLEYIICIIKFGTIPILSADIETMRFEFPVNGYIHLLAILSYPVLFILIIDRFKYSKLHSRIYNRLILIVLFFSILFGLGLGGRGTLAIFFLYIFIGYSFMRKIKIRKLIFYGFIAIYLLGLVKLGRDFLFYGPSVFASIGDNWIFGENVFLMPLFFAYLGIAMNYSILTAYVNNLDVFYNGYFTFIKPFADLLPGEAFNLIELQSIVLNKDFHGTLTNTILGIPYIDFGYFGAFILFFLGIIVGREYILIVKYNLLRNILPYSYIYAMLIMGVYTYPFGKFHILFFIFIVKIFAVLIDKVIVKQKL